MNFLEEDASAVNAKDFRLRKNQAFTTLSMTIMYIFILSQFF